MTAPFDTIRIGTLDLPNRLAMAPVKTALGTAAGLVTDRLVAYFRRRAEGGIGLIVSEPLYIDKRGQEHPKQLGIDSSDKVEGLHRLVEAVQAGGSRIFAHLNHAGRASNPKAAGKPPEAPSRVVCPRTGIEPEVLTQQRIAEIVRAFSAAARRAKKSGFDGVELQFGLGYLVSQFLSPATNLRDDGYGGDPERRARFAREVYSGVREAVGKDYPIAIRISGSEKVKGGLEVDDAINLSRGLGDLGIDLLHVVSGSNCESLPWYFQHMALPSGVNEALAAQIRKAVTVPVMAAGRLGDPSRIRELFRSGMIDMVALGRPLLADPDLPRKMRDGRDDEISSCGHCLQGCFGNVTAGKAIGCNFNPSVGNELDEQLAPAARPRRVAVVGGGPAGMQAALCTQRRGHKVVLFEKGKLGGRFSLASMAPTKERMEKPLRSLVAQVERSGIDLRVGEEATRSEIERLSPDVLIIATGSRSSVPSIAGLHNPIPADEVFRGPGDVGQKVLVLGGGMVGMEVSELLAKSGRQIVVIELLEEVGNDMDPVSRKMMLSRLSSLPVEIHTTTELVAFENEQAIVGHQGTRRELGKFDSVIIATGSQPFDPLSKELGGTGVEIHVIGDAIKTGNVSDAIGSGYAVGTSV